MSQQHCHQHHPNILSRKNKQTKLIMQADDLRLLHAGLTFMAASLAQHLHILGAQHAIWAITRRYVICQCTAGKTCPQLLGQLPSDGTNPGFVFEWVGVDCAGPMLTKSEHISKPTITKSYICVFVSFSVKAVHLKLVSDLSSATFIATLWRFVIPQDKPSIIWHDHGTNFVGASRELKEMYAFLKSSDSQCSICDECSLQGVQWCFIPENVPHFGRLWEAVVKSLKHHLRLIVRDI